MESNCRKHEISPGANNKGLQALSGSWNVALRLGSPRAKSRTHPGPILPRGLAGPGFEGPPPRKGEPGAPSHYCPWGPTHVWPSLTPAFSSWPRASHKKTPNTESKFHPSKSVSLPSGGLAARAAAPGCPHKSLALSPLPQAGVGDGSIWVPTLLNGVCSSTSGTCLCEPCSNACGLRPGWTLSQLKS